MKKRLPHLSVLIILMITGNFLWAQTTGIDALGLISTEKNCLKPFQNNDPFSEVTFFSSAQNTSDTNAKPVIGDVDGDGIPDVVSVSVWNQNLRVMATTDNQQDGSDMGDIKSDFKTVGSTAFPTGMSFKSNWYFEPELAIADIDRDGNAEIFGYASNKDNADDIPADYVLVAFEYDAVAGLVPKAGWLDCGGTFPQINGAYRPGDISVTDFDGDGLAEILIKDRIYAADNGELLAYGDLTANWDTDIVAAPLAANITGDDKLELVAGNKIYQVPDFSVTGQRNCISDDALQLTLYKDMNDLIPAATDQFFVKTIYDPAEYDWDNFSSTSMADLNMDGNMEIVLSGAKGSVEAIDASIFVWDVFSDQVASFVVPSQIVSEASKWGTGPLSIGNIDNDPNPELVFSTAEGVWTLEYANNTIVVGATWEGPAAIQNSRTGLSGLTLFDFNLDGTMEIIVRDEQNLMVLNGVNGEILWQTACQAHTRNERPVVVDANGDGTAEICVPCSTNSGFDINAPKQQQALGQFRFYYSEAPAAWPSVRNVWNQSSYFVTHINSDLSIPFPHVSNALGAFVIDGCSYPLNTFNTQTQLLNSSGCTSSGFTEFDIDVVEIVMPSDSSSNDGSIDLAVTGAG
ncbi:MAG: VCBS repeat-containing protein, partial [Cyclobacteriaceae bacterium]|nr:VCBS repeat-containing protein [Cyclobacteriaceae bacterium]